MCVRSSFFSADLLVVLVSRVVMAVNANVENI